MSIDKENSAITELLYLLRMAEKGTLPNTEKAVKGAAGLIRGKWVEFAGGGSLKGVEKLKRPGGGYAKSIKVQQTGAFEHEIYSDSKVADWIENGTKELDMKTTHPYGSRSRVSPRAVSKKTGKVLREGSSYLIVPFRWGTPKAIGFKNIIPAHIYSMVKKLKKTQTTAGADNSPVRTPNARGEMKGRAQYEWGGRFEYALGNANFSGMVRSTDSTGKNRSGGYFTFRVISSKSKKGWVKPAEPARHVTRALAEETRESVNAFVESGLMEDLRI
jgi:hypothetical protein